MGGVERYDLVFLPQGALVLFAFFGFFELAREIALPVAMHTGLVLIDAELICDLLFIDLVVGAQHEIDHTLGKDG